jgi:hypothetical protein
LNVHGVNDIRQREIHTVEPLVPKPSAFEVELDIEKPKRNISPGTGQIPAEVLQAGGKTIRSKIHNFLIPFVIRSQLFYTLIRRLIKQILVILQACYCVSYVQNFIKHPVVKVNSICRGNN